MDKVFVALVLLISSVDLSVSIRFGPHGNSRNPGNRGTDTRGCQTQFRECLKNQYGFNSQSAKGFQPSCFNDNQVTQAIAKFENSGTFPGADGKEYPYSIKGVVTFTRKDSGHTRIHAVVSGTQDFLIDSEFFSLHVHQIGETNPSCSATADHYNPCNKNHSDDPTAKDRHVGDMGRVIIPSQPGKLLVVDRLDTQVKLSGPLSVLGRSVTVHAGSASTRVGCGTIAVTQWESDEHPDTLALLSTYYI